MKDMLKLILVPTLICMLSGSLLGYINNLTETPIALAKASEKLDAISNILPDCDNKPGANTYKVTENDKEWTFYIGRKNNEFSGVAVETSSSLGYGGDIVIMIGIDNKGNLMSFEVLSQKETPGLGAKITTKKFQDDFPGKSIRDTKWQVTKDGGDIDEITAATISSRAVLDAIQKGIDVYLKHEAAIKLRNNK